MSASPHANGGLLLKDLRMPDFRNYAVAVSAPGAVKAEATRVAGELLRDVMRLNETLAEMKNNFAEYGEGLYHITVMGEPSDTQPWGWQLDGHHLIVNYFVLGDQVVMTPSL